jgi:hypothetical protein
MTVQEFRSVFEAVPFRPFSVFLADGREVAIRHEDYASLSPTGRTLIVYQDDDSFQVLDLMLATGVEVNGKRAKKKLPKKCQ